MSTVWRAATERLADELDRAPIVFRQIHDQAGQGEGVRLLAGNSRPIADGDIGLDIEVVDLQTVGPSRHGGLHIVGEPAVADGGATENDLVDATNLDDSRTEPVGSFVEQSTVGGIRERMRSRLHPLNKDASGSMSERSNPRSSPLRW